MTQPSDAPELASSDAPELSPEAIRFLKQAVRGLGLLLITVALLGEILASSSPGLGFGQQVLIGIGLGLLFLPVIGRFLWRAYQVMAVSLVTAILLLMLLELLAMFLVNVQQEPVQFYASSSELRVALPYYQSQSWSEDYWRDFDRRTVMYFPFTGWRSHPMTTTYINIDGDGVRLTPGAVCHDEALKIFVMGGSTAWGTGAPDAMTIPAYLQAHINDITEADVCVMNMGDRAFIANQSLSLLQLYINKGDIPDMVIFYDGANDIGSAYESQQVGLHRSFTDVRTRFEANTAPPWYADFKLYQLISSWTDADTAPVLSAIVQRPVSISYSLSPQSGDLVQDTLENYLKVHETVAALGAHYGFDVHFFWQPLLANGAKQPTSLEQIMLRQVDDGGYLRFAMDVTEAVHRASLNRDTLTDISPIFDEVSDELFIDHMHITRQAMSGLLMLSGR